MLSAMVLLIYAVNAKEKRKDVEWVSGRFSVSSDWMFEHYPHEHDPRVFDNSKDQYYNDYDEHDEWVEDERWCMFCDQLDCYDGHISEHEQAGYFDSDDYDEDGRLLFD